MNKELLDIYNSTEVAAVVTRCFNGEDCKQDVFTELLTKDESYFENIKDLKSYIVKSIFNKSKKQVTYEDIDKCDGKAVNFDFKTKIDTKCLTWFESEILELYLHFGSYGKVSNYTTIPKSTIFNTMTRIRNKLKHYL